MRYNQATMFILSQLIEGRSPFMMRRVFFIVLVLTAIVATACGTIATPEPSSIEQTEIALLADETHDDDAAHTDAEVDEDADETHDDDGDTDTDDADTASVVTEVPTEAPTATDIPPTATPVPPTATPLPPTATLEPPTATPLPPTEEPTEEASTDTENLSEITLLIQENGNASDGETQFAAQGCIACHTVDEGGMAVVGPNQWELYIRAAETVDGLSAEEYVYRSIIAPSEYISEGFFDGIMPPSYEATMTEQQLIDVVAYLLSLGNEEVAEEVETSTVAEIEALAEEPADTDEERVSEITLLIQENGDPTRGQQIFTAQACMGCHTVDEGGMAIVGPNQWELYLRAGERVEGLSAEEYVYRSIIEPSEYIVEGFTDGMMPQTYDVMITPLELYDVVAYLLSLGAESE